MTEKAICKNKRNTATFFGMIVLFLILLLLKNPSVAAECVMHGLSLCAKSIIPALFPFMVLSEILIACGFGELFGKHLGGPISALFGISRESSAALFLGFLCGFPVGARMALALYDTGRIDRTECERLLGFSNLPSIAFLVSAVGVSLYRSRSFGILLWLAALASACLVGILTRKKGASRSDAPIAIAPPVRFSVFPSAIANATSAMLSICAYILFFEAVLGCLSNVLPSLAIPEPLLALIYGFFELTSGVRAAASISNPLAAAIFGALTVGWSGLSIHCQLLTLCDGRGLSYRFYFRARLAEALICALIVLIFAPLCL